MIPREDQGSIKQSLEKNSLGAINISINFYITILAFVNFWPSNPLNISTLTACLWCVSFILNYHMDSFLFCFWNQSLSKPVMRPTKHLSNCFPCYLSCFSVHHIWNLKGRNNNYIKRTWLFFGEFHSAIVWSFFA